MLKKIILSFCLLSWAVLALAAQLDEPKYQITYPNNWHLNAAKEHQQQCYWLMIPLKTTPEEYTLEVCHEDLPLEKAIEKTGIFSKSDNNQWMVTAGAGIPKIASKISGEGWEGIKAIVDCGINDKEGHFHAAAGKCLWVIISDGNSSLVFDTVGFTNEFKDIDAIIQTTKFKTGTAAVKDKLK